MYLTERKKELWNIRLRKEGWKEFFSRNRFEFEKRREPSAKTSLFKS
jgi:hypothetical protein